MKKILVDGGVIEGTAEALEMVDEAHVKFVQTMNSAAMFVATAFADTKDQTVTERLQTFDSWAAFVRRMIEEGIRSDDRLQ